MIVFIKTGATYSVQLLDIEGNGNANYLEGIDMPGDAETLVGSLTGTEVDVEFRCYGANLSDFTDQIELGQTKKMLAGVVSGFEFRIKTRYARLQYFGTGSPGLLKLYVK